MPRLSSSASSTGIQIVSKQGLDFSSVSRSSSMPKPQSHAYSTSIRRFRSRGARPTVASIADIFVSSLVIAGFCQKHSPRGRGLATVSRDPSEEGMTDCRSKSATNHRLVSPRKRLDYSKPSTEYLGACPSKTRRMFSSQSVPSLDNHSEEGVWTNTSGDGCREGAHTDGQNFQEDAEGKIGEEVDESVPTEPLPVMDRQDVRVREALTAENPGQLARSTTRTEIFRYYGRRSPETIRKEAVSELFSNTIGTDSEREEAMKVVTDSPSNDPVPASNKRYRDTSRDEITNPAVERFLVALWDENKSNQFVFRLYRELPSPGVAQLSMRSRGALLRRFADPPDRRWVDARRYLALVEDMNTAGLPVSRSLWTTAIHLAGRASGRVFKRDLQRAIGIWHQMEHVAGIKSDSVVFNILFDISIKAGQYTVADRLMDEMEKRDIKFSRSGKVSKIYYHGFLQDLDGIRQAFDNFIKSGEIVDTVVLNCLIVSFLRAGELSTAEQLYDRMIEAQKELEKQFPAGRQHLFHHPSLSYEMPAYRKRMKKLGRTLQLSASLKEQLPEQHRLLQAALPMTPDTRTFHIFLSHHASQTGNLYKFMSVLSDMERTFDVPPRAMVYLFLFEGFARFGRRRRHWSAERLQDVWKAYLRVLYDTKMSVNDRFMLRREKLGWENPLAKSMEKEIAEKLKDTPNELYTPLPSQDADVEEESNENDRDEEDEEENEEDADEDEADEMLQNSTRSADIENELEELERRIENGVFLGRRVILAILRAFGVCSGPDAVMNTWLQIERIWKPKKRKALDVLAIKEELEKQISRKGAQR